MLLFGQAIISTLLSLARKCPACGRRQVVPSSRKRQSVPCRNCGAQIPPKDHEISAPIHAYVIRLGPDR
jgi:transcription elongation factor Elf1